MAKTRHLLLTVLLVAAAVLATPWSAWAQSDTGVIDGRVVDQTKAAVPGATITARNVATGFSRSAVSGEQGTYRIEFLPPGTYEVKAELANFSPATARDIVVQVGTFDDRGLSAVGRRHRDRGGDGGIAARADHQVRRRPGDHVGADREHAAQRPASSRICRCSCRARGRRTTTIRRRPKSAASATAARPGRSVNITVDGGDNNDGVVRGLLQQFSADAIQEYKVTTGRYSAEFGRSTGGVVNVDHQERHEQLPRQRASSSRRDDSLNAKTFFEEEQGIDKQPFEQQQFGGTVGGPIRKDRAHFFGSYEFNRRQDFATVDTNGVLPERGRPAAEAVPEPPAHG